MPTHGLKLKKLSDIVIPSEVKAIVEDYSLLPLVDCPLTMLDDRLLISFVERWHIETYSFHLSFGEMTITLDDVSLLFHIPLADSFFTAHIISQETAHMRVAQYLGVTEE